MRFNLDANKWYTGPALNLLRRLSIVQGFEVAPKGGAITVYMIGHKHEVIISFAKTEENKGYYSRTHNEWRSLVAIRPSLILQHEAMVHGDEILVKLTGTDEALETWLVHLEHNGLEFQTDKRGVCAVA